MGHWFGCGGLKEKRQLQVQPQVLRLHLSQSAREVSLRMTSFLGGVEENGSLARLLTEAYPTSKLAGTPVSDDGGTRFAFAFRRGQAIARVAIDSVPLVGAGLGPRRHDAVHACVGDELAHVLVVVNDDAEVHAVYGDVFVHDPNLALKVAGL
jgi:hypothetical protein